MTPNYESNSSFSPQLPTLQLAWDSTSLGALKECPRKYEYSIILGYAPRAESVHLIFGQHYHSSLERYDHARSAGADHEAALDAAVEHCLTVTWDSERKRPWQSDDPNKNRETLLRTVVWYLEQFKEDSIRTLQLANGRPAVELSFKLDTGYASILTGEPFLLCGHMDRIGEFNDALYILDRKTSKNTIGLDFYQKYSPDNQFSTYALAGKVIAGRQVTGIIVDAAQVAVTFSRFERGIIERKPDQLDEWFYDLSLWLGQAEVYAKNNYWPQNDKSCGNYGGCPFREICSKSPSVREEWLSSRYTQRRWDPLVARGDI